MIKLEQVRELNEKVQSTLEVVRLLREENTVLKGKLAKNEGRVKELEVLVSSFRNDQDEIEEGIKGILLQLDRLEEEFTAPPAPRSEVEKVTVEPSSEEENDGTAAPEAENASAAQESSNSPEEPVSSPMESTPVSEEVAASSEASSQEGALESSIEHATEEVKAEKPQENIEKAAPAAEPTVTEQPIEVPAVDSNVSELDIF